MGLICFEGMQISPDEMPRQLVAVFLGTSAVLITTSRVSHSGNFGFANVLKANGYLFHLCLLSID